MNKARRDAINEGIVGIAICIAVMVFFFQTYMNGIDPGEAIAKAVGMALFGSIFLGIAYFIVMAFVSLIGRIFR